MDLSPREIVKELDKYIIGQEKAKRAVAIALRNRYRRSKLSPELREEITPKNIIMKGPTGVGKTEIARRLAKLVKAPFIKVEATQYTEVGYVGRDVESMIRDLVEASYRMVKEESFAGVSQKATAVAEKKVLAALSETLKTERGEKSKEEWEAETLERLRKGDYDKFIIETDVAEAPPALELANGMNAEITLGSIFDGIMPKRRKKRKITVKEAMEIIVAEESDKLIDNDAVKSEAVRRAEEEGIIFIDEIDKIANGAKSGGGSSWATRRSRGGMCANAPRGAAVSWPSTAAMRGKSSATAGCIRSITTRMSPSSASATATGSISRSWRCTATFSCAESAGRCSRAAWISAWWT